MSTLGTFTGQAYQNQEETYFDDGREIALLHFIYNHPNLSEMRNNPDKVIAAIDEYGKEKKYLMNIGEFKSGIVTKLIAQVKPRVMVELGGYVGYSAIVFGAALRAANSGGRYYSLEYNPEFGAVIASLVDLAGLHDVVKVEIGASSSSLQRLYADGTFQDGIDLLFLDHVKPLYVQDLKLCEELGIVRPGSVLAADNVVKPGNPPYLKYVRSSVQEKRDEARTASGGDAQSLPHRTSSTATNGQLFKLNDKGEVTEPKLFGNPNLVYESEFVEGWEPSGVPDAVEITRCTGVETS
ncbi:S-adenosyl-L-methionine-dependent methyltransferase [Coniella lustricola]|uniref:catechol O-methyltransferase n=1 Tax=Coniella lustricola TaxID=2025994 RepID=A0A2T2ZU90_9PEZI|nr:S-adenosyl-L-methionine-dependent methyltransferase [Coniella lustricola]